MNMYKGPIDKATGGCRGGEVGRWGARVVGVGKRRQLYLNINKKMI